MRGTQLKSWEGHTPDYWRRVWQSGATQFFDTVTSTNDVVADLAESGAPDFAVVLAEEQTRGRGRSGARWQAQPGTSLLFSVLIRIAHEARAPGCAPIRAGLAVADAIALRIGNRAAVKWPNDVLVDDCGKVAGVLCEAVLGQGAGYIIVGIGINVLQGREQFAPELRAQACSLLLASGTRIDRAALLTDVIANLRPVTENFAQPLTDAELDRLAQLDVLRDCAIAFQSTGTSATGIARGIARDGALLVQVGNDVLPLYNATVRLAGEHNYPGRTRG